jgi:hypothetical protein
VISRPAQINKSLAEANKPRFQQTSKTGALRPAMYEPTILHQLAKLHGAIRAYQDLDSEIPDRRVRLLQSAHELTGTKYRSLGAALSDIEKKIVAMRAGRPSRRSSSHE